MSLRRLAAAWPDSFGPSRSHPRTLVCQLNLPDLDRFAGSSLLTLQKMARLMPFQVVQGGRKSLKSKVSSLKSGSGRGQWLAWGAQAAWPRKLLSFTSSHPFFFSLHRRRHLLDGRPAVAPPVGGTLCRVWALGRARPAGRPEPDPNIEHPTSNLEP